jgi:hypothetical protein
MIGGKMTVIPASSLHQHISRKLEQIHHGKEIDSSKYQLIPCMTGLARFSRVTGSALLKRAKEG